ncbi:MAG: two-component hybrid sensor and regulator [Gemmatimonadetes bacterium]|jgi:PAS domain S-box-containing protein|nr:two-component hybrid sensor and regulator [Gemmatimonadota bacterium]
MAAAHEDNREEAARRVAAPAGRRASDADPLSARDRAALRHGGGTRLPVVFVLVSLALALLVPRVAQRRVNALRDNINLVAEPARSRVAAIQLDLALEAAARRGYLLTGDVQLAREITASRLRRREAEQQLLALASRLGAPVADEIAALEAPLAAADAQLDSTVVVDRDHPALPANIAAQQQRFDDALAATARLYVAIRQEAEAQRERIATTENAVSLLTGALVLLGLGAAIMVARLGARFHRLALRLDESDARFRQIAENLSAVVWLSDPSFRQHLYVNGAYERLWGRSRESLLADPGSFLDSVHPDDRDRVRASLAGIEQGEADVEFRVVRPDGEIRWSWARNFAVRDDEGRIFRIAGIIEDITDRREHALERERLLDNERQAHAASERRRLEVERITESRARLIRGFTHDVKNPLGAADGFLALLEEEIRGTLSEPQREWIARARRAIDHALELIGQLLDLARAEAGQLEIRRTDTEIAPLVREVADAFRSQASAKGLTLSIELPPQLPVVRTDPRRLRQVFGNLVSNAVKYTPPGGHIRVCAAPHPDAHANDQRLALTVSDDGPGIPEDRLPLLFMEFTRFDPAAAEGAGIGLAISQKIAQALGGDITVASRVGRGSTFTLELPVDSS